jgi:acetyltransferase-like isoleucine patch superfamily enzyme
MLAIAQFFIREFVPVICGIITKVIYMGKNVSFGRDLRCDSIPKIMIDKNAKLFIGDSVELRRSVELRIHEKSNLVIGNKVRIDRGVRILSTNKAKIDIKEGVRIGLYSVLNGGDSITIGEKALISGFVYLQTSQHGYSSKEISVQDQGYNHAPIMLGNDAWLGAHVVVMPGINIGKGGVVGSNAVVTKNVEPFQVVAGIPAKPIKER